VPLDRIIVATGWTGKEYLIWGGSAKVAGREQSFNDGAAFNPVRNEWRKLPAAPVGPRHDVAAAFAGGRWFLWGGVDALSGTVMRDGATYDPQSNQWTKLPDPPKAFVARHGPGALAFAESAWIWGGKPDFGESLSDGALFSLADNTWTVLPESTLAGRRPSAIRLDNRAMLQGGADCSGQFGPEPCQDGVEYNLTNRAWSEVKPIAKSLARGALSITCEGSTKTGFFLAPNAPGDPAVGRGTFFVQDAPEQNMVDPPAAVLPQKSSFAYAGCIQGQLVAFAYNKSRVVGATFDPTTRSWSKCAEPEQVTKLVQLGAAVQVGGDEMLLWGGSSLFGGTLFSHIYQP
jgi:hypothetical protein